MRLRPTDDAPLRRQHTPEFIFTSTAEVTIYGRADHRGIAGAGGRERRRRTCAVKHGIIERTFYKWKAKFGGLDVSDAKRLKALEDENAKLKKLLAETMLDNAILKDINSRKW